MSDNTALITLADTERLGNIFVKSGFFADARQEAQAIVKILAGRELGLGPIASMTGIYVVQGRITLGANVIAAIIKRSGHYDFRVLEITDQICRIEFFEIVNGRRESLGISVFSRDDAIKAGTQNMTKFARNMLYARCLTNGARWYCPDVYAGGIYTPEEMGAIVDGDGEVLNVQPTSINPQPAELPALLPRDMTEPADEPPSDAEFRKLTSATEERKALQNGGPAPAAPKLAANHAVQLYGKQAAAFAAEFPTYQTKTGVFDDGHIRASIASLGYAEITPANIEEAFGKLSEHALSKEADAAGK